MQITIEWIVAMLCMAVIATWVAYQSTLIQHIKKALWLTPADRKTKYKWWFRPIVTIWHEFQDLLECPYCISFHLGWLINYFYFKQDIVTAVIYGSICIVFVELYRKLTL